MVDGYASEIYNTMNTLSEGDHRIEELVPDCEEFEDKYHWHCNKLIFDDTIGNNKPLINLSDLPWWEKKHLQRIANQLPRFIKYYGDSMSETGRCDYLPIAVSNDSERKKNQSDTKSYCKTIKESYIEEKRQDYCRK